MISTLFIKDKFCDQIHDVRASALEGGFATWTPNKGQMGYDCYEGMGFVGRHDLMLRALTTACGSVFPTAMFFRATTPGTEAAYVHSDRTHGDWTCVAYLSEHKEVSGTGFYRHRETGMTQMPTFDEMRKAGILEKMKHEMIHGGEKEWEQLDFVRGTFNRAVIFHAPLFHSRVPKDGLGDGKNETARMTWVCHFNA